MATSEASEALRQSEGGHEVGDGQQQFSLPMDPAVGLFVLTLGTVAVLAGVVLVVFLLALGAKVELTAHGLGAAGADVSYGPPVAGQEPFLVFGDIVRAMQAEDIRQLRHC